MLAVAATAFTQVESETFLYSMWQAIVSGTGFVPLVVVTHYLRKELRKCKWSPLDWCFPHRVGSAAHARCAASSAAAARRRTASTDTFCVHWRFVPIGRAQKGVLLMPF